MAITQTQQLPAPFLQDVTKDYATRLGQVTAPALVTSEFAPKVAPQDQYQTEAYSRVPGGIGAYQPYITQAGAYDTAAAGYTGPQAYQQFMSPYQQDIIDATMQQYDKQASQGILGIGQMAAQTGNLGGGREECNEIRVSITIRFKPSTTYWLNLTNRCLGKLKQGLKRLLVNNNN